MTGVQTCALPISPAHNPRYYEVPLDARVRYGAYYLLLLGFLCYMTFRTHLQVEALRNT